MSRDWSSDPRVGDVICDPAGLLAGVEKEITAVEGDRVETRTVLGGRPGWMTRAALGRFVLLRSADRDWRTDPRVGDVIRARNPRRLQEERASTAARAKGRPPRPGRG